MKSSQEKTPDMTDEEAKAIAQRTWVVIQAKPELKFLIEWLKERPNTNQGLIMIFDCIGCNIEEYEKMISK